MEGGHALQNETAKKCCPREGAACAGLQYDPCDEDHRHSGDDRRNEGARGLAFPEIRATLFNPSQRDTASPKSHRTRRQDDTTPKRIQTPKPHINHTTNRGFTQTLRVSVIHLVFECCTTINACKIARRQPQTIPLCDAGHTFCAALLDSCPTRAYTAFKIRKIKASGPELSGSPSVSALRPRGQNHLVLSPFEMGSGV